VVRLGGKVGCQLQGGTASEGDSSCGCAWGLAEALGRMCVCVCLSAEGWYSPVVVRQERVVDVFLMSCVS
jgi:hypothetical protein